MERKTISGRTITLKIRFANFHTITRSQTLPVPLKDAASLYGEALQIFLRSVTREEIQHEKIRMLGIQLSHLYSARVGEQLWLF
ncbi:MAG TPA: hypothetical protein PLY93_03270 [Turneriella sp.]|nr:hypothetical protein [Turneriella sp.]